MKRTRWAPAEGWLTVGLVLVMCLTVARAFDDARWVLGREEYLDLLVYAAVGGALFGFVGPKVGWGRWLTFLVGSIFAALIVPLLTALAGATAWSRLADLYVATAHSMVEAYTDLAIRGLSATPQILHHILIFGLITWATSMFMSYAVFGHHRPLGGIVIGGLLLVGNMAITGNDQLPYLVLFSLAALLLLVRSHAHDEESEWLRRRIGDPGSISAVYLRGGSMFIAVTVVAAFVLTQTASSAPLAGAWRGAQDGILSISSAVSRYLPTGGTTRTIGLAFGPGALGQIWNQSSGTALTISRDPRDPASYYWRVETYDQIDVGGRTHSQTSTVDLGAGAPINDYLAVDADPADLQRLDFTVTPVDYQQSKIVSAGTPSSIDEPIHLTTSGAGPDFAVIDRDGGQGSYDVSALVAVDGNGPGELNQAALRAAGTDYPADIAQLYLQLPAAGLFGTYSLQLEADIVASAKSISPYDIADSAVTILRRDFRYDTDIRNIDCAGVSAVECFAHYRRGFCQYYAVTMAALLRDRGIPTRIVAGFLPGARNGAVETVAANAAHEWVEVYFPGYGWVQFDPTPPSVSNLAPLPSGHPAAGASAPTSSGGPLVTLPPRGGLEGAGDRSSSGAGAVAGSAGPLIAIAFLLLIVVAGIAFLAWQRGPRSATVDGAYGSVIRIASRLGFRPRPAETVYEYAGALGEVLPDVRPELQTVATAKVESTYGRQVMTDERMIAIRAAQRRLRVGLLRLALRPRDRRRK